MSQHFSNRVTKPVVRAIARSDSTTTTSVLIAVIAVLMAGANIAIWFPGDSGADGRDQYAQAVAGQFDDWHPPIMAWLWSGFRLVADGNGPMLCFQVAGYWLGLGLIALALARASRPLAASVMLAVGLFPPFLALNVMIQKDAGLAVTFLMAVAALFWYRVQDREVPRAVTAIAFVLLLYGALVRANAVFAVVPLFVYLIRPQWLCRPWRVAAASIPIALALVPAANLFNHRVLQAEPLGIVRALQIFDITGVAFYSGDLAVFGEDQSFTREDVANCYVPMNWDPLSPWGECRFFWNRLAVSRDLQGVVEKLDARAAMGAEPNPQLRDLWVDAIVRHPFAYARHRLANFSSEVGLLDLQRDVGLAPPEAAAGRAAADEPPPTTAPKPAHLVLYDMLTAPALWLAIGAGLLLQLASARSVRRSASIDAALALLLSSLPYSLAYLVIGVGTELRYVFWSLLAIVTALVISLSELSVPLSRRHRMLLQGDRS
jgi:hypothetical protein